MKKNTIIFDLDGTLALIEKRRLKAGSPTGHTPVISKIDWDVFFDAENIQLDEPNYPVIKMAQMFAQDGFKIVIFSGRNRRVVSESDFMSIVEMKNYNRENDTVVWD